MWAQALKALNARGVVFCAVLTSLLAGVLVQRGYAAAGTRALSFYNIHTKETTAIDFKRDGQFLPGALEKFNWVFRDWRKNEPTLMDPALLDLLWDIHTELGSKQPIHIISGYRSRSTNDNLRATVGGQASESRHILGQAVDVHFPDVPLRALRYSALIREKGGVGFYPTSAIEFVHVDTDRVRHWPRLPRHELALLFPAGQSKHLPADGGPITSDDVRAARAQHQDLSKQIAAFYDSRTGKRPPVAVAGLDPSFRSSGPQVAALQPAVPVPTPTPALRPPAAQVAALDPPKLMEPPRLVDRPSRFAPPSATEQARLAELVQRATFTPPAPKLVSPPQPAVRPNTAAGTHVAALPPPQPPQLPPATTVSVQQAPDFDEDHPEELSYRPFPVAPLMTLTASADDPTLAVMTHPDAARTFEWLDQLGSVPPMRFRAGLQVAEAMMTQQFRGEAVNLAAWSDGPAIPSPTLASRPVRTR